jgi:hypothetical protein
VKRILVLMAIFASALVIASTASANGLTCSHGSAPCQGRLGAGQSSGSSGGTLPFTGLDLGAISAVGLLLLGGGLALRRVGRRTDMSA